MITGRFRLNAGIDNPRIRLEITSQWQAPNLTWLIDYSVAVAAYFRRLRLRPLFPLVVVGIVVIAVLVGYNQPFSHAE